MPGSVRVIGERAPGTGGGVRLDRKERHHGPRPRAYGREDGGLAHGGKGGVEAHPFSDEFVDPLKDHKRSVAFIEMPHHRRRRARAALASLPIPRMISRCSRISRSPPHRRADSSDLAVRSPPGSYRASDRLTRPIETFHTLVRTARSPSGTATMQGAPSGLSLRDRHVGPVQTLVDFELPSFLRDGLVEYPADT